MDAPAPAPRSEGLTRNAAVIAVAAAVVRISGLLREVVFAAFFGAGMATDAYNAAFRASQFFRELLAEGSLANIYVPIFSEASEKDGLKAAWRLANAFLGLLLLLLGAITIITFVFAEGWVYAVAWGFSADPEKFALTATLTRIMAPFLATVSLASLFMGMLNVRGRFFLPAVAPASFNLAIIVACFAKEPFEAWSGQPGILLVAIASVVGGVGQFAVQLPALYSEGFRFRPRLYWHPRFKRLFLFAVPAFIGIMTVQFNLLVESQLASRFGDGPVSYLQYAFRLAQLPNTIVAAAVGTAALAGLSAIAARGRRQELASSLGEAISLTSFLVIPSSVGLYMLADPIIELTYERGAFTPEASQATAAVLRMYALATWGICLHRVLLPSYYAIGYPYFPMGVAIATMAAKLPVALALVYPLGLGFIGLPLSHCVLISLEVALLWWGLGSRAGRLPRRVYSDHLRILAAAAVMGLALHYARPWAHGLLLLPLVAGASAVFFVSAHLLGLPYSRKLMSKLRRGRPRGLPPTVDPQTSAALRAMAGGRLGALDLRDGVLHVSTDGGAWTISAVKGVLLAESGAAAAQGHGAPLAVRAVMRVGQGPPALHGLQLGERSFRAEGDLVADGHASGPVIPVTAD